MVIRHTRFAAISTADLVAGAVGLVLFGVCLTAFAQTPAVMTPGASQSAIVPAKPPVTEPAKVLADPTTKMYSRCTTGDEHETSDNSYKPNPKAALMTEEAAKAKGYRAGAHKVACK